MNKRQECAQVYQQTCEQATHTKEDWYSLLESISRLYKYSFSEQAFIHAQNPHATACATSKIWNDAMHRYIKGGSKGIAVIDYSQTEPKINYVFDVNDTQEAWHKNAHPKFPNHWQITDEPSIVAEWKKAGLNSNTLSEQINERLMQSLHFCKDDADYQAIFASVSYVVHKRCGLSSNIANHDFQSIQEQDVSKIGHIGFMVSRQSQIILREIESIAKQQERKKERGDSLQTRGGLSSSRLRDGQPTQATIEQVRHGTQSLPRERTSEPVQSSMYDDGIVSPLLRSGDASQRTARNLNEPTPKERPTTRQSDTAHRVDSSHEQSQSTSGRNHLQGTDLQPIDPIDIGEKESETLSFDNISDEPYVVIEWSESPYFEENELLRFTQADAKFKTVERHERNRQIKEQGELGGYDKTSGIIHCKTTDGKSLTYKFRYDIGDYDENQSGLYNHIHSFWDYQDKHPSFVSIQEDTEFGLRFAKALQPYQSEFDYSMPIVEPTKYSESKNEPYVVIHSSESPYFNEDEILIFHEADEKFKLAEPHESHNESADDYQNVRGAIHYTSNHTISTYEFSYDIGTYRENQAGLYNHIRNSKEVETRLQLLSALESYQSDFDYSTQPIEPDRTQQQESESKQPTNYRITDDFTSESAKRTCAQNMEAITLLTQIEKEERFATPHEQEVLALYVGWGGIPQAFDADNRFWKQEYESLKTLLSPEEYEQARASTLNAHYTSPVVINAMYQAVEQMGFSGGKVLEPALGTGNFFGSMPQDMAQNSQLQGVELDPLTARIAKQLYPTAQIHNTGFEKTNFPDDSFDLVISNVPFGSYAVMDMQNRSLNALNANIHDYFIAKSLEKVHPNGMVAVITSKGTMDKSNPKIRQHLAERAELVAAIRLPNNAFEHAKTEVTTDILFFQKRERPIEIDADWIHVATNDDGVPMNEYFIEHPEMVLGEMVMQNGQYGQEVTCKPIENTSLQEQLQEAISHIHVETPIAYEMDDSELEADNENEIYAHPEQRPYSYCVHENEVYFKNTECMSKVELNVQDKERMKQLIALRDCTQELIQAQANGCNDEELQHFQQQLNQSYDRFSSDYGRMNDRKNKQLFDGDSSYYLLCSLEVQNEEEQFERKSDIFFQRTIGAKQVIAHADTSYDALIVSMTQKMDVDMPLMQELTGFTAEKIEQDLQGIIFRELPNQYRDTPSFVTADDYLSGNVVERLEKVKQFLEQALPEEQSIYAQNISSLEQVQPEYLSADKIMVHIGTTWIEPHYYTQFMHETFEASPYLRSTMQVHFEKRSNEWEVSNKRSVSYNDVIAYSKYGTSEQHAYQLLENTLNLKTPVIYKTIDKKKFVDEKATLEIQQKQEELQEAFSSWLWQDPERRTTLEALYNHKFNEEVPRKYNGDFLAFENMNPLENLRPHQRDAVARTIFGGNSLLAHEVGAGKTYELIASAMESKRLGLCSKSLIVVLKPTVEDFATAAMTLYPSKNILVVRDKDFEKANRKKFCARIATGDYDAVIMAHSQFEKIAMSKDYQEIFIKQEIAGIVESIEDMSHSHDSGKHFSIKKLESVKKNLQHKLAKLSAESKKDDVIDFELLGIDRLYVDESHMFKNLFYKTKLQGIAGLANSESQRATDMFMKCRYLDKKTNHKGVIFATGTPLANSLVELYTNMRFLMYDKLIDKDLEHFDAWVSTYAKVDNVMELSPEGNSFRVRQRLSKFFNLPELKNLFCQVADIKTKHNMNLPLPKVHAQNVLTQPSTAQEKLMENLLERAKAIRNGSVKPEEDNMLKLTGDGKKIGLDARLMNENLLDDENSKVNTCVKNVVSLWEKHETDKATQIIFCDTSTPKKDGFNLYDDIKQKLIKQGVPEKEIAFIHDAKSDLARKKLFAKMRSGSIRILIGSTQKCGTGVNVQNRLIATHNLDCPWRPIDLEQRLGRMERQGNQFSDVYCFNYVTEKTFDSYLWQTNEHKMAFISQIMTENSPLRECEDINEATLEYSQIKALCVGDTRIQEVMQLDMDIKKLQMLESAHKKNHYNLQDKLVRTFPQQISMYKNTIETLKKDEAMLAQRKNEPFSIEIDRKNYHKPKEAKEALKNAIENAPFTPFNTSTSIGNYMGMDIRMYNGELTQSFLLQGSHTYKIDSDNLSLGQIQRKIEDISPYIQKLESEVNHLYQQIEQAKIELQQPFLRADELKEKKARKIELTFAIKQDETKETNENEAQNVAEGQDVAKEQSTDEVLPNQAIEKEQTQPEKSSGKVSIFQKIGAIKAEQHQQNECTSKTQENQR